MRDGPVATDDNVKDRGVADGEVAGVRTPAFLKTARVDPQNFWIFQYLFKRMIFGIFKHFQDKVAGIRGETFGEGGLGCL